MAEQTEQDKFIEQLQSISPKVKEMLEPIKKLSPLAQELALIKLYEKLKLS